jgi:hypothetical protein
MLLVRTPQDTICRRTSETTKYSTPPDAGSFREAWEWRLSPFKKLFTDQPQELGDIRQQEFNRFRLCLPGFLW